jgi:hypothetical protein
MSISAQSTPVLPCLVFPAGHARVGQCLAPLDGISAFAAAPAADFDPDHMDRMPAIARESSASASLCLVQRVSDGAGGRPPLYRNWCHPERAPFPIAPGGANEQSDGSSLRALLRDSKLLPLSVLEPTSPEDPKPWRCPAGELPTLDLVSGRITCAAALTDPCPHALLPNADGTYMCRPQPGAGPLLPNPCPEGTWLVRAENQETEHFRCVNPCGENQVPRADGSGAFVCVRPQ